MMPTAAAASHLPRPGAAGAASVTVSAWGTMPITVAISAATGTNVGAGGAATLPGADGLATAGNGAAAPLPVDGVMAG